MNDPLSISLTGLLMVVAAGSLGHLIGSKLAEREIRKEEKKNNEPQR